MQGQARQYGGSALFTIKQNVETTISLFFYETHRRTAQIMLNPLNDAVSSTCQVIQMHLFKVTMTSREP